MRKLFRLTFWILFVFLLFLLIIYILIARPILIPGERVASDTQKVSPQLLEQHVKKLSLDFLPRDYSNIENLNRTAAYIKNEFEQMGLTAEEQVFTAYDNEYKNIITHFGPTTGAKLVIGAHYDVAGELPGADDNASGVAGLIELARQLKSTELKKGVTLVAYTLEEPPVYATENMGSFVHAKSEFEKDSEIELMISLEMIGYYSDIEGSQNFPVKLLEFFYPSKGDNIVVVDILLSKWGKAVKKGLRKHMDLPVYSINAPRSIPGIDFSDHRSYWNFSYPAVMLTDTSFYRNTAYHTPADTYERLNYQKMSDLVGGLAQYVIELSNK